MKKGYSIYLLYNTIKDKLFIEVTPVELACAEEVTIRDLEAGEHFNRELQEDYNLSKGKRNSELFLLESTVFNAQLFHEKTDKSMSELRQKYHKIVGGELYLEHDWENSRKEIMEQFEFDGSYSLADVMKDMTSQLDYSLEYACDRVELVDRLIDEQKSKLVEYLGSPQFLSKSIKTQNSMLTENDYSMMGLTYLADYLIFCDFIDELDKQEYEQSKEDEAKRLARLEEEKKILKQRIGRGKKREVLCGTVSEIDNETMKTQAVQVQHKITEEDLKKHDSIRQLEKTAVRIAKLLGIGEEKSVRDARKNEFIKQYGAQQFSLIMKIYREIRAEQKLHKELLERPIRFKSLLPETTVYNFDSDTFYDTYDSEKDEYGERVIVSKNKINFNSEEKVLQLIELYGIIKESVYEEIDSDLWAILHDFEALVDRTPLEDYERHILHLRVDRVELKEIVNSVKEHYNIDFKLSYLSRVCRHIIPQKIVEQYRQDIENYVYTYKIKGVYKQCSKCKEVKLRNENHFGARGDSQDGFMNICKKCR